MTLLVLLVFGATVRATDSNLHKPQSDENEKSQADWWWVPFTLEVGAGNDVICVDHSPVQKVGIRYSLRTQTQKQHVHW